MRHTFSWIPIVVALGCGGEGAISLAVEMDSGASIPEASTPEIGVSGDDDAGVEDASTTDSGPLPDSSGGDAAPEAAGPDVLSDCEPLQTGDRVLADLPPATSITFATIHRAFATTAGLYLSYTNPSIRGMPEYGLQFVPEDGSAPTTTVTPHPIHVFFVVGPHAYFLDGSSLTKVDLSTGTVALAGLTVEPERFGRLRPSGGSLYWFDEGSNDDWSIFRAPILGDGSIGAPETLPGPTDATDFWFVDSTRVMLWLAGTPAPVPFGAPEPPDVYLDLAIGSTDSFLAMNAYGPPSDGGCSVSGCTSYPGPQLSADVFRRPHGSGTLETLHSSAGEVFPIAATSTEVYWGETHPLALGACRMLWRSRHDGSEPVLLTRNETGGMRGALDLLAVEDTVYWVQGSLIFQYRAGGG